MNLHEFNILSHTHKRTLIVKEIIFNRHAYNVMLIAQMTSRQSDITLV